MERRTHLLASNLARHMDAAKEKLRLHWIEDYGDDSKYAFERGTVFRPRELLCKENTTPTGWYSATLYVTSETEQPRDDYAVLIHTCPSEEKFDYDDEILSACVALKPSGVTSVEGLGATSYFSRDSLLAIKPMPPIPHLLNVGRRADLREYGTIRSEITGVRPRATGKPVDVVAARNAFAADSGNRFRTLKRGKG